MTNPTPAQPEGLLRLMKAAAALNVATDGMEALRAEREGVLAALTALARAPAPEYREWSPHLDYAGEPVAEGQFRDEAEPPAEQQPGEMREKIAQLLRRWHRDTCYPDASPGELLIAADAILALVSHETPLHDQQAGLLSVDDRQSDMGIHISGLVEAMNKIATGGGKSKDDLIPLSGGTCQQIAREALES